MGGLTALVQAIMGSIIAPRERGRYAGYMGAVMAVSHRLRPAARRLIVDTRSAGAGASSSASRSP